MPRRRSLMLAALALPTAARAQGGVPLRLVVGFPPGSTPDVLARLFAAAMAVPLGRNVIVENRPGAGGLLAADVVAKGPADGSLVLVGSNGPLAIAPHVTDRMPFDPARDLRPAAFIGVSQQVLVARPGLAPDLTGFLILSRTREITYGSVGNGSASHLVMAGIAHEAGLRATHVPYRGAGQAFTDLGQGRIDAMVITVGFALPHIQERRVAVMAATGPGRVAQLPEVPTLAEAGLPGFELPTWNGLYLPAATPDAVVARIAEAAETAAADPAVRRGMEAAAFTPLRMSPEEIRRFVAAESARWGQIARATGARLED